MKHRLLRIQPTRLLWECGFRLGDHGAERCRVENRNFRKYLSVDLNAGKTKPLNELGVFDVVVAASGADSNNPKSTEIALLLTAVTKSVLSALHHLFVGDLKVAFLSAPIAFCSLEDFLVSLVRHRGAFYASHILSPLFCLTGSQPEGGGGRGREYTATSFEPSSYDLV